MPPQSGPKVLRASPIVDAGDPLRGPGTAFFQQAGNGLQLGTGLVSSNLNLSEILAKIDADEDVSPAELRLWFDTRGSDRLQGKRGEYNLGVLRRYQVR
jgi:hypothetical protein